MKPRGDSDIRKARSSSASNTGARSPGEETEKSVHYDFFLERRRRKSTERVAAERRYQCFTDSLVETVWEVV